MVTFLGTLQWPAVAGYLGVDGVSPVELLILSELWAGERLVFEKAVPKYCRAGRANSGPGIDLLRSCRFTGVCCGHHVHFREDWVALALWFWS